MSAITVLAGGWSASRVNLKRLPGTVIAVNDAAYYAPKVDIVVSMDRLWTEHRIGWLRNVQKETWLRRSTTKNLTSGEADTFIRRYENDHRSTEFSDDAGTLNGTHSGFCALNLAYQMRPERLYLVGFDMARGPHDEAHWFPQYPWVHGHATGRARLVEWSSQFGQAALQLAGAAIQVYLCESELPIRSFKRLNVKQLEAHVECAA